MKFVDDDDDDDDDDNYPSRCVFSRRWNVFSDRLLSRSADGRRPWKSKLRWSTDVCTLGRSTHPVAADGSRGHPWTFSTGTQNSSI